MCFLKLYDIYTKLATFLRQSGICKSDINWVYSLHASKKLGCAETGWHVRINDFMYKLNCLIMFYLKAIKLQRDLFKTNFLEHSHEIRRRPDTIYQIAFNRRNIIKNKFYRTRY